MYIVACSDGTFYTGYTFDIIKRLELHNKGRGAKYTRARRPVKLVWYKKYRYFKKAVGEERRIKKMRRLMKEELIRSGGILRRGKRKMSFLKKKKPGIRGVFSLTRRRRIKKEAHYV